MSQHSSSDGVRDRTFAFYAGVTNKCATTNNKIGLSGVLGLQS